MYYKNHAPPHFHAYYGPYDAQVGINEVVVLRGRLPTRALSMVFELAAVRQKELRDNWDRTRLQQPLQSVPPLE